MRRIFNLNDIIFSGLWFSRVKTVEMSNAEGVYFCGPIMTRFK